MVEEVSQIGLGSDGFTIYIYIMYIYMIVGLAGSTASIQIWIISNLFVFALFFLVVMIFVIFRSGIGMVETAWACSTWMFQEGSQVDYRPNVHQLCKEYVNICRCHWGLKPMNKWTFLQAFQQKLPCKMPTPWNVKVGSYVKVVRHWHGQMTTLENFLPLHWLCFICLVRDLCWVGQSEVGCSKVVWIYYVFSFKDLANQSISCLCSLTFLPFDLVV